MFLRGGEGGEVGGEGEGDGGIIDGDVRIIALDDCLFVDFILLIILYGNQ